MCSIFGLWNVCTNDINMNKVRLYDYVYWSGIILSFVISFFRLYNLMALTVVITISASGFLLISAQAIEAKVKMRLLFTYIPIILIVLLFVINSYIDTNKL